jgi:hypothetical protein
MLHESLEGVLGTARYNAESGKWTKILDLLGDDELNPTDMLVLYTEMRKKHLVSDF